MGTLGWIRAPSARHAPHGGLFLRERYSIFPIFSCYPEFSCHSELFRDDRRLRRGYWRLSLHKDHREDSRSPLKESLPRLQELLGVKLDE